MVILIILGIGSTFVIIMIVKRKGTQEVKQSNSKEEVINKEAVNAHASLGPQKPRSWVDRVKDWYR